MGGVRTPEGSRRDSQTPQGLENNVGYISQLIHPHPCSSEMRILAVPWECHQLGGVQEIKEQWGDIQENFLPKVGRAEGLGSWEQRPSLSGVLRGEKPWCQPHSCCAWPGRGDWIWGEYSPNGFKTGVSYKSNPHGSVLNWILGRIRGSATGPKVSIRSFPKPRSRGEGSGLAPSCFHLSRYLIPKLSRCPEARKLPLE